MRPQTIRVCSARGACRLEAGKFTCPVFTGKLHVTQVNCAKDLFTFELHVKLPAFAGNFARAIFTVSFSIKVTRQKLLLFEMR